MRVPPLDELSRGYLVRLSRSIRAVKRRGQHFVIDPSLVRKIVSNITPGSTILEVGTGLGILTFYMAQVARRIVSIEVDDQVLSRAREILEGLGNVELILGDALSVDWPKVDILVSNPPYSITTPLLVRVIREGIPQVILTLQSDVVDRIMSGPGDPNYGRLSIMVQCAYEVRRLGRYPASAFYPRPRVSSALIIMRRVSACYDDLDHLSLVTSLLFRHRNRLLRWVAKKYLGTEALPVNVERRVRELSIGDVVTIADYLRANQRFKSIMQLGRRI